MSEQICKNCGHNGPRTDSGFCLAYIPKDAADNTCNCKCSFSEASGDSAAGEGVPEWKSVWVSQAYWNNPDNHRQLLVDDIECAPYSPVTVNEAATKRCKHNRSSNEYCFDCVRERHNEDYLDGRFDEWDSDSTQQATPAPQEDKNLGEVGKPPVADVERSPLPAQESGFFEARIRNQAENIVYSVFGYPKSTTIGLHDYAALVGRITNALLVAHRASDASNVCTLYGCERGDEMAYPTTDDLLANLRLLVNSEVDTTIRHALKHGLLERCLEVVESHSGASKEYVRLLDRVTKLRKGYEQEEKIFLTSKADKDSASYFDGKATALMEVEDILEVLISQHSEVEIK